MGTKKSRKGTGNAEASKPARTGETSTKKRGRPTKDEAHRKECFALGKQDSQTDVAENRALLLASELRGLADTLDKAREKLNKAQDQCALPDLGALDQINMIYSRWRVFDGATVDERSECYHFPVPISHPKPSPSTNFAIRVADALTEARMKIEHRYPAGFDTIPKQEQKDVRGQAADWIKSEKLQDTDIGKLSKRKWRSPIGTSGQSYRDIWMMALDEWRGGRKRGFQHILHPLLKMGFPESKTKCGTAQNLQATLRRHKKK